MTRLVIEFEGSKIRCVGTPDRPEWVAADVCRVLGINNPRQAVSRLESDEKGVTISDASGQDREMATLTEPGLYKLVSRSRKPIGKRFSRFIFHEVLPCIRKHGCYPEPEVSVGKRKSPLVNRKHKGAQPASTRGQTDGFGQITSNCNTEEVHFRGRKSCFGFRGKGKSSLPVA